MAAGGGCCEAGDASGRARGALYAPVVAALGEASRRQPPQPQPPQPPSAHTFERQRPQPQPPTAPPPPTTTPVQDGLALLSAIAGMHRAAEGLRPLSDHRRALGGGSHLGIGGSQFGIGHLCIGGSHLGIGHLGIGGSQFGIGGNHLARSHTTHTRGSSERKSGSIEQDGFAHDSITCQSA